MFDKQCVIFLGAATLEAMAEHPPDWVHLHTHAKPTDDDDDYDFFNTAAMQC
jgi:hypothetical protein